MAVKIKLSELKAMIREEYNNLLNHDHPSDVDALESNWGVGKEQNVHPVNHMKAYGIKEGTKRNPRKLRVNELRNMILKALHENNSRK
jgi:predicted component of type VI protein secretion system